MVESTPKEGFWFQVVGRTADYVDLRTSSKGTDYARLTLIVQPPTSPYSRKVWLTAFGKTARALAEQVEKGDLVKVKGDVQRGKNANGQFEEKFIAVAFEVLAKSPDEDSEQVGEAMKRADFDDITF